MVSSVLGATSTGEEPGEVTIRPLRPPQRARLLEKWIRVAEVREDCPCWGPCCGKRSHSSLCDPHRSAVYSETSLQFMLLCQPCSPAPSTGFGQPGGKQPGREGGALDWDEGWERGCWARPIFKPAALYPPGTVSGSSPASVRFSLRRIIIPRAGSYSCR